MLSLGGIFDVDRKERRLEEVNREMENPDLWNDPEHAQKISKEKKTLEDLCGSFKRLTSGIADAKELFEMSLADNDEAGAETVAAEVEGFEKDVEKLEFKRMFNQPMDSANCYLEIQAGAGGTEAQDWASMLERMYLRYAERSGFSAKLTEETEGDVAGIKGCTIFIEGEWAYGTLRTETGIHRLVRKSPFDANARRHTSFASVSVCQDDRSQHNNREQAMRQLKAKLYEAELRKRMAAQEKLEESKSDIGWGHQIRSYVLDQSRVKDLRTNVETGNTGAVLDGDLEQFIEASLKQGI